MKAQHALRTPVTSSTQPGSTPEVLEEIRLRAYELFERRGRNPGHDREDWLQAEAEVLQRKAKITAK